jgi:hypothetical protein
MNEKAKQQYAELLGSATMAHILATSAALVRDGYYTDADRDDLIQELTLTCVTALARSYVPERAERSTFLIACINRATKRLKRRALKEKTRTVRVEDAPPRDRIPLAEMQASTRLDVAAMMVELKAIDRDIVAGIASGLTPTEACRRHGLRNTYFVRHVRPLVKKIIQRLRKNHVC